MKRARIALAAALLAVAALLGLLRRDAAWTGVDEPVAARAARRGGRPPHPPYIDTNRGDLLLFLFLLAGAAGGFIGGFYFRGLFPPARHRDQ
jgi:hypothetical protein